MESVSLKYGVIFKLQPKKELHSNSSTIYVFRFILFDFGFFNKCSRKVQSMATNYNTSKY